MPGYVLAAQQTRKEADKATSRPATTAPGEKGDRFNFRPTKAAIPNKAKGG